MLDIIDVQTREHLETLLPEWLAAPAVALDTEFFRERTYFPIAGLIQLSIGGPVYLIDPLAIDDLTPLRRLFEAPMVKVLHSTSEDLEVFQRVLGCLPAPLADTQTGAALAGYRYGIGYQALVEELLGEPLDKGETRSDWLRRPLTARQRHYAAMDVAWLLPVYRQLHARLEGLGRLSWWEEESARTLLDARQPLSPSDSWRRLKGAGRLRAHELAVLRSVCEWRELEARGSDLPRGHVIKDAVCLELARRAPRNLPALAACEGVLPQQVKRYGAALLQVIAAGRASLPAGYPAVPRAFDRRESGRLQQLRERVEERAAALHIAPELLARRRDLESLLRDGALPASLCGWRDAEIGQALLAAVDGMQGESDA